MDKLDNKLQHTTSKLVTDLPLLQNCPENGEFLQRRHFSTFLHELMLHFNGLSIISKFHLAQWLSLLSELETLFSKLLNPKGKHQEYKLLTRILISTHSLRSCCSLSFFLLKFFSVFLQNLLVLSFFGNFLCHYLHKSPNFLNSRKAPFSHKKQ